ncbi:hypothetical protein ACET3Z_018672 [Daucus carota]
MVWQQSFYLRKKRKMPGLRRGSASLPNNETLILQLIKDTTGLLTWNSLNIKTKTGRFQHEQPRIKILVLLYKTRHIYTAYIKKYFLST